MSQDEPFLNRLQNRVSSVVSTHGDPPWVERLVLNEKVAATLICAAPGTSRRRHYHPDQDEFWIVMGAELVWEIEKEQPIYARSGDIVRVPKQKAHNSRSVGDGPSLRLAIVVADVPQVDVETGEVFT